MFQNIKQLSESLDFTNRLIFGEPSGLEVPQPTAEEMEKRLKALKESMSTDFRQHLETYSAEIKRFLESDEAKKYDANEWKRWNVKLLEYMGFKDVSLEDSQGIIRRLQEYLKTLDKNVVVDGQFGPGLLRALKDYYQNQEKKEGWVPGVTKASFDAGYEMYYLTHDGRWINKKHEPVDVTRALLRISGKQPNSRGYTPLRSTNGEAYYVDRFGNTYANVMPPVDETAFNAALEQGVDPSKKAQKHSVTAREYYFRYPDGTFTDREGNIMPAKDVIPKITHYESKDKSDPSKIYYGIETQDGKIAYYDAEGMPVEVMEDQPAPAPVSPPTPRVAPVRVAAEKPMGWVEGVTKYAFVIGEADKNNAEIYYVLNDGRWVDWQHDPINLQEVLPRLAKAEPMSNYYSVKDGSDVTLYVDRQGKVYANRPASAGPEDWIQYA